MKLSLDPTILIPPRHVTAEAEALADWYDANPGVRRLWAIRNALALNVIVTLEPTVDNSDTSPPWLACGRRWASEIQALTGNTVSLELLEEPLTSEFDIDFEGEIIAALSWRDPTSFWKAD
jgi:hypothetical protein